MPRARTARPFVASGTASALGAVLLLSACQSEPPGPQGAAEETAAALASGDLAGAAFLEVSGEEATEARDLAFEGLGETPVTVEVASVSEPEGEPATATADLTWTWDLPGEGEDLVRDVSVTLRLDEEAEVWQPVWSPEVLGVAQGAELRLRETPPERADLVDRAGEPLATLRDVTRVGIDKTRVEGAEQEESALALADLVGLDPDAYATSVAGAGDEAFVEAITYRDTDETGQEVIADLAEIPGAAGIPDSRVLGPSRTFAQPWLGSVGEATQELIEAQPELYEAGDLVGLGGLQAALDADLRGTPGLEVTEVVGEESTVVLEREPEAAEPIALTLDTGVQQLAEDTLADVEPASALVALDTGTGDVLALANGPGSAGLDTAGAGQYAPGSTFKIVTALALLRAGYDPDTTVSCPETLTVDGFAFENVPGYPASSLGEIPLLTAIASSCNTAMVGALDDVPMDVLAQAATDLGLGGEWHLPVSAFSGRVPDEAAGPTEHAVALLGQGPVLASPLAMAVVAATVDRGETVTPRILLEDADGDAAPGGEDGDGADATAAPPGGDAAVWTATSDPDAPEPAGLTDTEREQLNELLRAVVTDGSADVLADNPGGPVIAKTGTAEYGEEAPPRTHAWMVAVQDGVAVAVFVEDGTRGSEVAGPLVDDFLTALADR